MEKKVRDKRRKPNGIKHIMIAMISAHAELCQDCQKKQLEIAIHAIQQMTDMAGNLKIDS